MRSQCLDRGVGASATIDRDVWLLPAADFGISASGAVELAVVVERRRFGPGSAQKRDVLVDAAIACMVVDPITVFGLIGVAATGDDVHRKTTVAELVQRRELASGERRCHEPRSMSQQ